jgi:hypothetical protein
MKRLWTGIVIVAVFCGCKSDLAEKDLGLRLPSPSGKYILAVTESAKPNEPPRISLGLRDAAGNTLDVARTDVPANVKWAAGWAPGEDVAVLCSDKGTSVYIISKKDEKLRLMECPQPKYSDIGLELIRLKYESSKDKTEPPAAEIHQAIEYHLQTAQYADTFGKAPEYVYVVGEVACRSLQDLKNTISHFPKGSKLRWAPSCRGPVGLSEEQEKELKDFCDSHGIKFIHVPSG